MTVNHACKLVISVDVEEEGLFCGRYPRSPAGVTNVARLEHLRFIVAEFGLPLTLLVTYQVARDSTALEVLKRWQEDYGAEIGAHLHPWNTPPFWDLPLPEPVAAASIPLTLMAGKLGTLVGCLEKGLGVRPRSFRMGRFDWDHQVLKLLPRFGLRVDSSMVPLTQKIGGPDHFLAGPDPFPLTWGDAVSPLLEVPLTMVSLINGVPARLYRFSQIFPGAWGHLLRAWYPFVGAVGVHPAWFPLTHMRLAVLCHRRRGGQVLNMFFHSSELLPGGTPRHRTEAAVQRFLRKIRTFLAWLVETQKVEGATLSDLLPKAGAP